MLKAFAIFLKWSLDQFTAFGFVTCVGDEIILFPEDERVSFGWIYDVSGCLAELSDVDSLGFGWTSRLVRSSSQRKNGRGLIRAVGFRRKKKKNPDSMLERALNSLQFSCLCFLQENPAQFTGSEFSSSDRDVHLQPPSAGTLRFQKRLSTSQDR